MNGLSIDPVHTIQFIISLEKIHQNWINFRRNWDRNFHTRQNMSRHNNKELRTMLIRINFWDCERGIEFQELTFDAILSIMNWKLECFGPTISTGTPKCVDKEGTMSIWKMALNFWWTSKVVLRLTFKWDFWRLSCWPEIAHNLAIMLFTWLKLSSIALKNIRAPSAKKICDIWRQPLVILIPWNEWISLSNYRIQD